MLQSPQSPYSPFRQSGLLQKASGRRTLVIWFVGLLCISATLNIAFLFSRLIPPAPVQAQLVEIQTAAAPECSCPSINCSNVCARNAYQAERAVARQAACSGEDAAAEGFQGAAGGSQPGEKPLEDILLFIGALSGRGYQHRRLAVRDAWAAQGQMPGVCVCRFVMSHDEVSPLVEAEMREYGDIVLVQGETTYKSILLKSLFVFEYALRHYDARFVLKTDDDAYVNVRHLLAQLRMLCESPDCRRERLYMGRLCTDGEVFTAPGHKWNNEVRAGSSPLLLLLHPPLLLVCPACMQGRLPDARQQACTVAACMGAHASRACACLSGEMAV
jgi:hypothetical protein